jgi:hypothetical protein
MPAAAIPIPEVGWPGREIATPARPASTKGDPSMRNHPTHAAEDLDLDVYQDRSTGLYLAVHLPCGRQVAAAATSHGAGQVGARHVRHCKAARA